MKLMIVDDSAVIRRKIERVFTRGEFSEIVSAENGERAVALFKTQRPQVVTMDLTMPEMDGIAAVKDICAIDPSVNILVVSALSDKATALQAIKNWAQGFLCKPFSDEQLQTAMSQLLAEV